jgi:hypothetical protein
MVDTKHVTLLAAYIDEEGGEKIRKHTGWIRYRACFVDVGLR